MYPYFKLLLCVIFGGLVAYFQGAAFFPGQNVTEWDVVSEESIAQGSSQTYLREGSLQIGYYAFGRSDSIRLKGGPVQGFALKLTPESAPVELEIQGGKNVEVGPKSWRYSDEYQKRPYQGYWTTLEQRPLSIVIRAKGKGARIESVKSTQPMRVLSYTDYHERPIAYGLVCGLLVGIAIAFGRVRGLLGWSGMLFPYTIPFWSDGNWIRETFYLVHLQDWEITRFLLMLSLFLPAFAIALRRDVIRIPSVRVWFIAAGGIGVWMLFTEPGLAALLGLVIVLSHLWLYRRRPVGKEWLRDVPFFLPIPFLGWGWGLFLLSSFRLLLLIDIRKKLLQKAPRPGAEQMFLMILLMPFTLEWALREGDVAHVWNAEVLEGNADEDWKDPQPFWSDRCGDEDRIGLLFVGGSSTGGAYQFGSEPEAFFPALVHDQLCRKRNVRSFNYGKAERDSHTISRTLEQMLNQSEADWIVLYIGHNDLTADNPYTRLERETRSKSLGRRLGRLARQSHLIVGADLLLRSFQKRQENIDRPPLGPDGKPMRSQVFAQDNPYAVPLKDAEQNILSIAKMAEKHDAKLLLVAQHIAQKSFNDLSEYWAMEKRLANNSDRIYFFDPTSTLKRYPDSLLLVDNNHFSKRGHIELSRLLSTEIGRLLTDNQ